MTPRGKKDNDAQMVTEGSEALAEEAADEMVVVARGKKVRITSETDPAELDSHQSAADYPENEADEVSEVGPEKLEEAPAVIDEPPSAEIPLESPEADPHPAAAQEGSDDETADGTSDQEQPLEATYPDVSGEEGDSERDEQAQDEARGVVEPVIPARQSQQVDSPMAKFRRWLKGSTTVGKPLAPKNDAPSEEPAAEGGKPEAVVISESEAKRELRKLRSATRSWESLVSDREQKAQQAQEAIAANDRRIKALTDWVTNFDRSYQWRVQQRMDSQLQQAVSDLSVYEQSVQNVEEFEAGRLSELRRSFHRLLRQLLLITVPIGVAVMVIPLLFRIPKIEALETFYDPRLSAPIVFLVVAAIIAAIFLIRRASGIDSVRNVTIVSWVLTTIAIGLIIVLAPVVEDPVRNSFVPYLEENQARILVLLIGIGLLWVVVALIIYYRGWSQYRRAIDTQLAKLRAVISGYVETQQEVNRLTLLYEQTSEWLRLLAFALYRPWVTRPEWEDPAHQESDIREFPFAFRVAQVDDQVGAKSAELERIISSKLLVQGWRASAFRDLVDAVRQDMGLAQGKFTVDALDKDLPHQTNNTRNLLRKYLESSAASISETSGAPAGSNAYLVEVARKRLLELIEQTQSVALSAARPPVNHLVIDPLEEIVGDSGPLESGDSSENWDGFLKETLGTDQVVQPPLSVLNFTPEGQMNKSGESPRTFVLIPQRLADALPDDVSEGVNLVPVIDNTSRAVEIIARIDVVGPLKPADVRLLSPAGHKTFAMSRESNNPSPRPIDVCVECFDPSCSASLDSSAACSDSGL